MVTGIEKIRDTMFRRLDPIIFRSVAYVVALGVVGTTKFLDGSWLAVLIAIMIVAATGLILPTRIPEDNFRKRLLAVFRTIRFWPRIIQLLCAILLVGGVVALDYHVGGFNLGRGFNVFLIPIFLCSLLFGLRVGIVTWLLSILLVYYCVIPPRYSFAIGSLKAFADLFIYLYLAALILLVPILIRDSSVLAEDNGSAVSRRDRP